MHPNSSTAKPKGHRIKQVITISGQFAFAISFAGATSIGRTNGVPITLLQRKI